MKIDWNTVLSLLSVRRRRQPVNDVATMADFASTRAAYVSQTILYSYLKARMGTQFRTLFQDEVFAGTIKVSAVRIFVGSLSDMAVFSVGCVAGTGPLPDHAAARLAVHAFRTGLVTAVADSDRRHIPADAVDAFEARAASTLWPNAAVGETAFVESLQAIIRHAPVIDAFKEEDRESVTNAMRFRWRDVRETYRKRLDAAAVARDWLAREGGGP